MITVLAPNPSVDKLFVVKDLVPGAIHRPDAYVAVAGGKGLNVARVAHALGADVRVLGIAAGATGRWLADTVDSAGIPATFVWSSGETRSCLSVAHGSEHLLTEFYEPGPPVTPALWNEYVELVGATAGAEGWVVGSGSLPTGAPVDGYSALLSGASQAALDTSGEALPRALSPTIDLVKVNAAEALEVVGTVEGHRPDLPSLVTSLRSRCGPRSTAVVTAGRAGALMQDADGHLIQARLSTVGRYPVGSGDAFLAGLLTAREAHQPWQDALRLATAAAAANAERAGAGVIDVDRVSELVSLVEVEEHSLR